jgi:hypothetical protein
MNNNNMHKYQKDEMMYVLVRYEEFFTNTPGKSKVYEFKFHITDTIPITGHPKPATESLQDKITLAYLTMKKKAARRKRRRKCRRTKWETQLTFTHKTHFHELRNTL